MRSAVVAQSAAEKRRTNAQWARDDNDHTAVSAAGDAAAVDRSGARCCVDAALWLHECGDRLIGLSMSKVVLERRGEMRLVISPDGMDVQLEVTNRQHVLLLDAEAAKKLAEHLVWCAEVLEAEA